MPKNLTMVRFKGGSGGDTLCWALNNLVNQQADYTKDNRNITLYTDIFSNAFQMSLYAGHHRFPFTTETWRETPNDELRAFIESRRIETRHSICKAHYLLRPDQWSVFSPCWFIDLLPGRQKSWLVQALHFHKTAFAATKVEPIVADRHPALKSFYERNGWVPNCWVMAVDDGHDPHDYDLFIKQHASFYHSAEIFELESDLIIDAGEFIIDVELDDLHRASALIGVDFVPDSVTSVVKKWVLHNRAILEKLGLMGHEGLTFDDKRALLHAAFEERFQAYLTQ